MPNSTKRSSPTWPPDSRSFARVQPRVLVVDDEPLVLRCFGRMLQDKYDVELAERSDLAILKVVQNGPYDVIISDLSLPGMDGVRLFQEFKKIDPRYTDRVLFVTGGAVTARQVNFLQEQVHPTLEKPVSLAELRGAVSDVLAHCSRARQCAATKTTAVHPKRPTPPPGPAVALTGRPSRSKTIG